MTTEENSTDNTVKLTNLDKMLIEAKKRKAEKEALKDGGGEKPASPVDDGTLTETPPVVTPADKAAAAAKRAADREARKVAKAAEEALKEVARKLKAEEKAAKKAAKEAEKTSKGPAHMKKVDRARAKLPALTDEAAIVFSDATMNLNAQQIDALAQHLMVHNRAMRTIRANATIPMAIGTTVRITGGEAKYVGLIGKVVHSQKLRAKVAVTGFTNPVYIYTGEAEIYIAPKAEKPAAEETVDAGEGETTPAATETVETPADEPIAAVG